MKLVIKDILKYEKQADDTRLTKETTTTAENVMREWFMLSENKLLLQLVTAQLHINYENGRKAIVVPKRYETFEAYVNYKVEQSMENYKMSIVLLIDYLHYLHKRKSVSVKLGIRTLYMSYKIIYG